MGVENETGMLKVECDRWNESASVQQKQTHSSRWTLKRLVAWINEQFNLKCCRESVRKTLQNLGFSGKKARKILNKANTKKRREYLEKLKGLLDDTLDKGRLLIFIDEGHIHLDCDEGNGWSVKGERFWLVPIPLEEPRFHFMGFMFTTMLRSKFFPISRLTNSIRLMF